MAEQDEQNGSSNPGEQGRASHSTGSTTQGGSNYGQGSSHLGGESYQQGHTSNTGANYENEANKLGNSTTGTNEEGSSSPGAGAGATEQPKTQADKNVARGNAGWDGREERNEHEVENDTKKLFEGDRRDTSLEQSSNMDESNKDTSEARGWSKSTDNDQS